MTSYSHRQSPSERRYVQRTELKAPCQRRNIPHTTHAKPKETRIDIHCIILFLYLSTSSSLIEIIAVYKKSLWSGSCAHQNHSSSSRYHSFRELRGSSRLIISNHSLVTQQEERTFERRRGGGTSGAESLGRLLGEGRVGSLSPVLDVAS